MCVPRARLAIGIGILVPLVAVLIEFSLYPPYLPDGLHLITGAVPRVRWDHRVHDYALEIARIAAARQPLVLFNSPAAHWPAIGKWRSDAYLASRIPSLESVVMQRDNSVHRYWEQNAPLARVLEEPEDAMPRQDLATVDVLAGIRRGQPYYYSRGLQDIPGFPVTDLAPLEWLLTDRQAFGNSSTLWVSGNGVTTAAHYDMSHNFFVQLTGTKRFLLSPPRSAASMKLHPWLHPLGIFTTRPQQRQTTQPAAQLAAAEAPVESRSADLSPGDVLYIPPLWFHSAVAGRLEPSLGANVWSNSEEGDFADSALMEDATPLPPALFEAESLAQRQALLTATVSALVEAVLGLRDDAARAWLHDELWSGRYVRGLPEGLLRRCRDVPCDVRPHSIAATSPNTEELEQVAGHARDVAQAFAELPAKSDAGVRVIQLLNLLESLAAAAMGIEVDVTSDQESLCPLLSFLRCFGVDG